MTKVSTYQPNAYLAKTTVSGSKLRPLFFEPYLNALYNIKAAVTGKLSTSKLSQFGSAAPNVTLWMRAKLLVSGAVFFIPVLNSLAITILKVGSKISVSSEQTAQTPNADDLSLVQSILDISKTVQSKSDISSQIAASISPDLQGTVNDFCALLKDGNLVNIWNLIKNEQYREALVDVFNDPVLQKIVFDALDDQIEYLVAHFLLAECLDPGYFLGVITDFVFDDGIKSALDGLLNQASGLKEAFDSFSSFLKNDDADSVKTFLTTKDNLATTVATLKKPQVSNACHHRKFHRRTFVAGARKNGPRTHHANTKSNGPSKLQKNSKTSQKTS